MISLRRIFGLMLLFFFFEAVVALVATFAYPDVNVFVACAAMTGLALAVWACFMLVTRLMMRPRVPQPAPLPRQAVVVPHKTSFGDDSFSQELSLLVAEANRRLAGAMPLNARGESPTVGTLPLYLVVGAEGAGKTSAILNSGMEPRLLAGEATRDGTVVPTRLCNLWFAEGAVFADLSGRLLTQETENWDRALRILTSQVRVPRWKRLLFGRRGQVNLKGLILVCDAGPFVKANDPQRINAMARTLGDRLQAAGATLRREFPVYVVFSKCDGVPYFPQFFSHLSEPEARRVLGATLPYVKHKNDSADIYADREGKRLTTSFNRLYMSLAEKRLVLLAREDEAAKKSTAYEFPRELKKLRGDVVQFLLDVFRPNPLQLGPQLRGFYLSGQRWIARNLAQPAEGSVGAISVVQKRSEATIFFGSKPSSPVAGPGAGLPAGASGAVAKWMFLTDLFHNVVLKDRAGHVAPTVNTREQEYRTFAFAGAGAVLLVLCLLWAFSWRNNRALLNSVQAAVQQLHPLSAQANTTNEALADLDTLQEPLSKLLRYDRESPPLSFRWGLYAGHDATTALNGLYFTRFRRLLLDPLLDTLNARFLRLDPSNPSEDDVYTLLKSYRMITSGGCKPDGEFLTGSLLPVWPSVASLAIADSPALAERQMQFYIRELGVRNPYQGEIAENGKAVLQAQDYLHEVNGPDTILRGLVDRVNHDKQGDTLGQHAPNFGEVLTGPNAIEAAYTREGWDVMMASIRDHKLASAGEACVIGAQSKLKSLTVDAENEREISNLYVKHYIQHWKSFLEAHHVETFGGATDAARKLQVLADNNRSPLLALVYMASRNTDLDQSQSVGGMVSQKIETTKDSITKTMGSLLGGKGKTPANTPLSPPLVTSGRDIAREFGPVRTVVDPTNSEKWLGPNNQAYMQALQELGNSLAALPPKLDDAKPEDQQGVGRANKALQAASDAHHALGALLPNTSSQIDVDLKALLAEPIAYAGRVLKTAPHLPPPPNPNIEVRDNINTAARQLCGSVDSVRLKYPFNAGATQEVTIPELNELFGPGTSAFAQFMQSRDLSKAYLRQGKIWAPNPAFPGDVSQPFLQELAAWSDFSEALYADGTGSPHFDYTLTLDGTGNLPYELNVDGHNFQYKPKKGAVVARLVWPPATNAPTRLVVKAGMQLPYQTSGLWSLLRLLQAADKRDGNVFVFSTAQLAAGSKVPLQDGKGNPVTVQIRIDSVAANVFSRGYFGKLSCDNFAGWALRLK